MSMTGERSNPGTTAEILSTLRELSAHRGTLDSVEIGASFEYCLQFCVMDDESLPWRAVELYRVFSNFSSFDESMDLLLGPATYDFRAAVAQVSEEKLWPLVLWSFFPQLGQNSVVSEQTSILGPRAWIFELLRRGPPAVLTTIFGALPQTMSAPFTCETLTVPGNYTLRPLAHLLPCNGTCQAGRDLESWPRPKNTLKLWSHLLCYFPIAEHLLSSSSLVAIQPLTLKEKQQPWGLAPGKSRLPGPHFHFSLGVKPSFSPNFLTLAVLGSALFVQKFCFQLWWPRAAWGCVQGWFYRVAKL